MDEVQINETELIRMLGGHSHRQVRKVCEALMQAHRTNQQGIMRFCMTFIEVLAEQKHSDLRNQKAVETARKIVAATTEIERIMPLI